MVTTSYVSDELAALHEEAAEKGLVFLNECGLDPGIDHFKAMDIIHKCVAQQASAAPHSPHAAAWCQPALPALSLLLRRLLAMRWQEVVGVTCTRSRTCLIYRCRFAFV